MTKELGQGDSNQEGCNTPPLALSHKPKKAAAFVPGKSKETNSLLASLEINTSCQHRGISSVRSCQTSNLEKCNVCCSCKPLNLW